MTLGSGDTDDELIARLDRVLDTADPVPEGLVDRIGFALALAGMETELAALAQDWRTLAGSGARTVEVVRTMTFSGETLSIMVTVTPIGADEVRIDGWLVPPAALEVELRSARSSTTVSADDDGRFHFDGLPHGLMQLVVHPTPGVAVSLQAPVVTHAVEL